MNTPLRIETRNGTAFTVIGDAVEINRNDQPVGYVPLADMLEFVAKRGACQPGDVGDMLASIPASGHVEERTVQVWVADTVAPETTGADLAARAMEAVDLCARDA